MNVFAIVQSRARRAQAFFIERLNAAVARFQSEVFLPAQCGGVGYTGKWREYVDEVEGEGRLT